MGVEILPKEERGGTSARPSDAKELVLKRLKEVEDRVHKGIEDRVQQAMDELTAVFERRIHELEEELAEKEEELVRARQREHDDGIRRSIQLDVRMDALARRDEELANRIAKLAAPQIEASGAVGAKAVVDASEKSSKRREFIRDIVVGIVLAIILLYQVFGKDLFKEEPPPPLPNPSLRPASGPGYGGRP